MRKLVHGLGTNTRECPTCIEGKQVKEYDVWKNMLSRCTEHYWANKPTYTGTTCSDNFKSYSYFYKWCQSQIGFNRVDESGRYWHLDKDLLEEGNKIYSENNCVFIPQRINSLLLKREVKRGEYPVGVRWHKKDNMFHSRCNNGTGVIQHLGCFGTEQAAFQTYKVYKEVLIKQVAEEYKCQIDPRAYQALLNYTVEITD